MMISKENNIECLARWREEYHSAKNVMGGVVDDFDDVGKLGMGLCQLMNSKKLT
jgi:hypothetical protein